MPSGVVASDRFINLGMTTLGVLCRLGLTEQKLAGWSVGAVWNVVENALMASPAI
jgi:hypothetical protein